jgi:hypothetical protein
MVYELVAEAVEAKRCCFWLSADRGQRSGISGQLSKIESALPFDCFHCAPGGGNNLQKSGQWSGIVLPISKSRCGLLTERYHAASVDGRIYESSRVTSEARPASYLQKTGGFYIAAGAHRFSQRHLRCGQSLAIRSHGVHGLPGSEKRGTGGTDHKPQSYTIPENDWERCRCPSTGMPSI